MAKKQAGNGEPTLADLKKRHAAALKHLMAARALFEHAHELPADDRRRSQGKLGMDEAKGLRGVVDAMDAAPEVFVSLADQDEGQDPNKLETGLIRERLDKHGLYLDVAQQAESLARLFGDQALEQGALVAPVLRAGYEIAKPVSKSNKVIRGKIAKLLDYHGANAARGAATRKANAAAKKRAPA